MDGLLKQYKCFIKIFNIVPSHIDKHNWENNKNEVKVMCDFAKKKDIPLRLYTR
jgi:predicted glycoside hydrolase/deacetylase ChbG (UPF0249 family)